MGNPRILFVIAEDWYFWSHRRDLARHLRDEGCEVGIATPRGEFEGHIKNEGLIHEPFEVHRGSKNPIREIFTIVRLVILFFRFRPDLVHLVGVKPILYGRIAALVARVPATVCAVCGMGWIFQPGGQLKKVLRGCVRAFYRLMICQKKDVHVIVQNQDDCQMLCDSGMVHPSQITRVNGAGVDTAKFNFEADPLNHVPIVMTHCRMLWDKGVGELVQASREIQKRNIPCRFWLVGEPDPANPASIPEEQLMAWHEEGAVEWLGYRSDISDLLKKCNVACLPSYYREGMPLSLIEAASCGRPIVTTDATGCREVVEDGKSGFLVPPRDPLAIVDKIIPLLKSRSLRLQMGIYGRDLVERAMASKIVNSQTTECYRKLLNGRWPNSKRYVFRPNQTAAAPVIRKAA